MTDIRLLLSTIDSAEQAGEIAETLVIERLAACVNILPAITSVYRWKNQIHRDPELLLIIKTGADSVDRLINRLRELHPYEVPEIIALPIEAGLPAYLDWVREQTS